ncbi:hypothetical protein ACFO72_004573 [Enterobacter roggenkampii]
MRTVAAIFIPVCALVLTGCAGVRGAPAPQAPASLSLLDGLSQQVSALRQQASQGDRQAENQLLALLSGQGVQVLMARHKTAAG